LVGLSPLPSISLRPCPPYTRTCTCIAPFSHSTFSCNTRSDQPQFTKAEMRPRVQSPAPIRDSMRPGKPIRCQNLGSGVPGPPLGFCDVRLAPISPRWQNKNRRFGLWPMGARWRGPWGGEGVNESTYLPIYLMHCKGLDLSPSFLGFLVTPRSTRRIGVLLSLLACLLAREFLAEDWKDGWRRAGCEANGAAVWVGGAAGMLSAVGCGWWGGGEGVEGRAGG
jgi:hypothetical protein